jgi:hypothetical protein
VRAQHGVVLQSVSSSRRQASRAARAASLGWVVAVRGGGRNVVLRKGASSAPAKQSALFCSSCFPSAVRFDLVSVAVALILVDFLFSDFAPAPTAKPSATSTPSRAIVRSQLVAVAARGIC